MQDSRSSALVQRDIVVVGASAGGVEALGELVRNLPAEVPASIFVVLHVMASGTSVLAPILSRETPMEVGVAQDGETIERGRIYVAPPDRHMVLRDERVHLTRGPRENGHRPSVDTLFRSAGRAYGVRVIGVVLSGALDDGAFGTRFVKRNGGATIAQDPAGALYASMPAAAIDTGSVDRVVPLGSVAAALSELIDAPVEVPGEASDGPADEAEDAGVVELAPIEGEEDLNRSPVALTCPECGGALLEQEEGPVVRFTCHVGHAFSPESLVAEQSRALEVTLWGALRSLEERSDLLRRVARRGNGDRHAGNARLRARASAADEHAAAVREAITRLGRNAPEDTAEPTAEGRA